MKTNILQRSLALLLLFTLHSLPFAMHTPAQQTQDAFYVYRNDGGFNAFFFSDVDRIEYSKVDTAGVEHEEYVTQEVYALDSIFRIPISAIDSIGFVTPETKYKSDVKATTESDLWRYVIGSDTTNTLHLSKTIPQTLIPAVGDKIVTTRSRDYLPSGFYGKVLLVTNDADKITVICETPEFTELFDEWVCKVGANSEFITESEGKRYIRRRSEEASDVELPLPPQIREIDLTDMSLQLNDNFSITGSGYLNFGVKPRVRIRSFLAVRTLLGVNFDLTVRQENTTWCYLNIKGGVSGSVDIPFAKTYTLIPNTPFAIETQGGISASMSGELELDIKRDYIISSYGQAQYNNSYYDWNSEAGSVIGSIHLLDSKSTTSFTGKVTTTLGPYYGVTFSVLKKEVIGVGMRYDAGLKLEAALELKATDFLFTTLPAILPAYMILNPTPVYDMLNRDASITLGPFCTGKVEFTVAAFKKEHKFLDVNTQIGKLECGSVPKFANTKVTINKDTKVPTASVNLSRRTFFDTPVGFAAYYAKSGKEIAKEWYKYYYNGHPKGQMFSFKEYKMELPKFGGGKAVRVYPLVNLQPVEYELLCSPYTEITVPVEVKTTPKEELDFTAGGGEKKITFTDNLDRTEDTYNRILDNIRYEGSAKDWLSGDWDGDDFVVKAKPNTSTDVRSAFMHFYTRNEDKSVDELTAMYVVQEGITGGIGANVSELNYSKAGGVLYFVFDIGTYPKWYCSYKSVNTWHKISLMKEEGSKKYVCIPVEPNTTDKERIDTLTLTVGVNNSKEITLPDVIIRQAPGAFNISTDWPEAAKLFAGTWYCEYPWEFDLGNGTKSDEVRYMKLTLTADGKLIEYFKSTNNWKGEPAGEWELGYNGTFDLARCAITSESYYARINAYNVIDDYWPFDLYLYPDDRIRFDNYKFTRYTEE